MYQPDVICGHFWKRSLCGGHKICTFLRELELLSTTRKAHEIDLLLYAHPRDKIGQRVQPLWRQRLLHIFAFRLRCVRNGNQTKPVCVNISFPMSSAVSQRTALASGSCARKTREGAGSLKTLHATTHTRTHFRRSLTVSSDSSFCFLRQANSSAFLVSIEIKQRIRNYKTALWLHKSAFSPCIDKLGFK